MSVLQGENGKSMSTSTYPQKKQHDEFYRFSKGNYDKLVE